jgi:anti-anti-sigma factor
MTASEAIGHEPALSRGNRDAKVTMQDGASNSTWPSVDVEHRPASSPAFAAIVHLCGEHDMATASEIAHALSSISGDVLVDLSECSFLDSSTVSVLLEDGRLRERNGHRLELLAPHASSSILRALEIMRVDRFLTMHVDTEDGDAPPGAAPRGKGQVTLGERDDGLADAIMPA